MKVAILAGGFGTRLSEETILKPKPMVEVGGKPLLWHIMKYYSSFGFNEFVIALGYKGEVIKDFFINYRNHSHDLIVSLRNGDISVHNGQQEEDWIVHLIDTGLYTQTGGRVKRLAQYIGNEPFLMTYGDGVCDVNLCDLIDFHQRQGKLLTVTAVRPPARFGGFVFSGEKVVGFKEKVQTNEGWINGGYFVVEPGAADGISDDQILWEQEPMEALTAEGQLVAYRHFGFWQCMDTQRDMLLLEELWKSGKAPWKVW